MAEGQSLKPLFLALPIDLHVRMVRADLDPATRDLCIASWSYVALHRTDGRLAAAEADTLFSSTAKRRSALVEAGFWRRVGRDGYEVVGYLDGGLNRTRAEIEKVGAEHRAKQAKYMRNRAAAQQRQEGHASND